MARPSMFLNSRSMLTPGIAGAMTMMIANTLHQQFDLAPRWTALGLSFAMSLLVFKDKTVAPWQRPLVYLLNGLVIFSMAVGANGTAQAVTSLRAAPAGVRGVAPAAETARPFFCDWFASDPPAAPGEGEPGPAGAGERSLARASAVRQAQGVGRQRPRPSGAEA